MMKRITKLIISLLLLIIILPNEYIEAYTFGPGIGFDRGDGEEKPPTDSIETTSDDNIHVYVCEYSTSYGGDRKIDINAYDMDGNSVVPYTNKTTAKFKAGTWVGINLREFKSISWGVNIEYFEKVYKCVIEYKEEVAMAECTPDSLEYVPWKEWDPIEQINWDKCMSAARKSCQPREDYYAWNSPEGKAIRNNESGWSEGTQMANKFCRRTCASDTKEGIDKTSKDKCSVTIISNAVSAAMGMLSPTLNFEIIDPNVYLNEKTKKPNILSFETKDLKSQIMEPTEIITDSYGENLICSSNDGCAKTRLPNGGIPEINADNYTHYLGGEYHVTYEYSPEMTCINPKTSKVSYQKEECKNKNYKEIENGKTKDKYLNYRAENIEEEVTYWHYFIPFDTRTSEAYKNNTNNSGFYISISSKNPTATEKGTTEECINMLKDYPIVPGSNVLNYTDYITAINSNNETVPFNKNYTGEDSDDPNNDMFLFTRDKLQCKISSKLEFNIEQNFYGENKEKTALKGYSFYYRPINPNDPFPNKIESNSIWYGLYNEGKVTIKDKNDNKTVIELGYDTAFKEVTYSTRNVTRNDIKNAIAQDEQNDNYTSWKNIDVKNGTSSFIDELHLRQYDDLKNIYKLGCGPDNIDWEGCK